MSQNVFNRFNFFLLNFYNYCASSALDQDPAPCFSRLRHRSSRGLVTRIQPGCKQTQTAAAGLRGGAEARPSPGQPPPGGPSACTPCGRRKKGHFCVGIARFESRSAITRRLGDVRGWR